MIGILIEVQISETVHFLWILPNFQSLPKTKTETALGVQVSPFKLKFECLPFRILEKCLLGTFSTLKLVSNGTKFFNFGPTECKIWFFKNCSLKLKFLNLVGFEFLETVHYLSILDDCFRLDFLKKTVFPCIIKPHFWVSIYE